MGWNNMDGLQKVPLDCTLVPVLHPPSTSSMNHHYSDVPNINPQPRVTEEVAEASLSIVDDHYLTFRLRYSNNNWG